MDWQLRELSVPPAPDDELPDMIKFKARAEFGSFNDDWLPDYVPQSDDPEIERTVFAVAISPETREQYTELASAAGIRLNEILFRPYAKLELLASRIEGSKFRLIVDSVDDTTDITVARGPKLITTRTVKTGMATDAEYRAAQLEREIKLTIASSTRRLGEEQFAEIVIVDDDENNVALCTRLETQTGVKTECVEPFALAETGSGLGKPEDSHLFAALLGALRKSSEHRVEQIDFLHPRQRVVKKLDLTKFYRIAGVAAAVLGLLLFGGWMFLRSQSGSIADLQEKYDAQAKKNDGGEGVPSVEQSIGEIREIDTFVRGRINWLDQMYLISANAGTPDDAIATAFAYTPASGGSRSDIVIAGFESGEPNQLLKLFTAGGISAENTNARDISGAQASGHERTFRVLVDPMFIGGSDSIKWIDQLARDMRQTNE